MVVVHEPRQRFCDHAFAQLQRIAEAKYIEHVPTIELLKQARDADERDAIGIIALLEVDDAVVEGLLQDPDHSHQCEVLRCRRLLRRQLSRAIGLPIGRDHAA